MEWTNLLNNNNNNNKKEWGRKKDRKKKENTFPFTRTNSGQLPIMYTCEAKTDWLHVGMSAKERMSDNRLTDRLHVGLSAKVRMSDNR